MSGGVHQSMFFLGLPDLNQLCCVTLSLQEEGEELRSKQIKTCRELVLLYWDVLASPALDSFTEITAVMAVTFFQKGILQVFGGRHSLKLGPPQCVLPGVLQASLSYSLITRLSPRWNKAGLYLINGKDFLTDAGRLNAVSMELSTKEGQLCMSIEANTVRLPPATLEDFDLAPLVLRRFCSDPDSVLHPTSTGGALWCHVLPSMKKGQIITISRKLPKDGPFRTYRDLQNHWNHLYGYRLPELAEEEVVYCSIYFRLVGERLFTYPLSCIRLHPVQRCPRVDLQGALGSFLSDIRDLLQTVCSIPVRLTNKPHYRTVCLYRAATVQMLSKEEVNLTSSCPIRPVLTQLPPPPPSPPMQPSFLSQPADWRSHFKQERALGILGDEHGFKNSLTQGQGCQDDEFWPSSCEAFSTSESSMYQSAPSLSSSSSFLSVFQPASSLTSSSSSLLLPLPPLPRLPPPKLVPIFKNKNPSRHVNVALLRAQKQRRQLIREGEERGRVSLPAFKTPTLSSSSSSSSVSSSSAAPLSIPPLPTIPHFQHHPKPQSSTAPRPGGFKVRHFQSLSPVSKSKARIILSASQAIQTKTKSSSKRAEKMGSGTHAAAKSSVKVEEEAIRQMLSDASPAPLTATETLNSGKKRVMFESEPKKSESMIRVTDVEKMARRNQLSKLNSVTLLAGLKGRGVTVSAKHKKEELMLKVMGCLAEA